MRNVLNALFKPLSLAASLLLVGLLSACGNVGNTADGNFGYAPPSYAGVNQLWLDINSDGHPDAIGTGGKEQSTISIKGSLPLSDGRLVPFEYTATDVKAFDGQQFRADVEKIIAQAQAETVQETAPTVGSIVQSIVDAAVRATTGGAL